MPDTDGLLGPADVRRLARAACLRPTKRLGQNFVCDPNTIRRIVRVADLSPADVVLEIGPGLGSLTVGLLSASAAVVAIEVDPMLSATLPETVSQVRPDLADRLTVLAADALTVLPSDLPGPPPTVLVSNLPYNVAVPVLLTILGRFDSVRSGLVMVQREVADRLVAAPGSRTYGAPTVKLAWYASARSAGQVSRKVFWPEPNVDSSLVAFRRRMPPTPGQANRKAVFAVVEAAFAQRRKTLRSALAASIGSVDLAESTLRAAAVDPGARGETLDLCDFVRIAAAIGAMARSPEVSP